MINVPEQHLLIIKNILQKNLPQEVGVKVFGSRITKKIKTYSDLDLIIIGKTKIDSKILANLKEEFEESDIPFRVDIIDWHRISKEFQQIIINQNPVPI